MDEKDIKNLTKIMEHANRVIEYTKKLKNSKQFKNEEMINSASLFEILQIGELVNNLSERCIKSIEEIPWNKIYTMRNRIVHGYASVDYEIVWETIKNDIPELIKVLNKIIYNKKSSL